MVERWLQQDIVEIIGQLIPLKECNLVVDEFGAGPVYVAPTEKGFLIGGKFEIWSDQNKPEYALTPEQSFDKFVSENEEKLRRIIERDGIDMDKAVEEMLMFMPEWLGENPSREFIGKKLKISFDSLNEGDAPLILVSVIGDTYAFPDAALIGIHDSLDHVDTKGPYAPHYVVKDYIDFVWQRRIAKGNLDDCTLELVDYPEPKQELWLPETPLIPR